MFVGMVSSSSKIWEASCKGKFGHWSNDWCCSYPCSLLPSGKRPSPNHGLPLLDSQRGFFIIPATVPAWSRIKRNNGKILFMLSLTIRKKETGFLDLSLHFNSPPKQKEAHPDEAYNIFKQTEQQWVSRIFRQPYLSNRWIYGLVFESMWSRAKDSGFQF